MGFPPLGNSDHVLALISIGFPINSKQDAPFHCTTLEYSCANWDSLCDNLKDVLWEDIFELSASTAASEFCELVQVGIDVYISHHKYQVKRHLSPWFSAACAVAIAHRNIFFCLYQQIKFSESTVKLRQASNCCIRVLGSAKLAYVTKTKKSITSQKLLRTFGELLIVFSTKVNLLYFLYSTDWMCCLLHLIKQNYLLKTFLRPLVLVTLVSF